MRPPAYPFAAIVGQPEMKLALLLAAIDWRLGVLLRGDKGSGKTTTARALAALLPAPASFVNLPIGTTEDRLLGGLHLKRALAGDPVLKPGLLSEAHGGVLYVDEVNLLPAHLGDALLDAAATGIHVVEREGLSATHRSEFVLLGSMNPEEGSLRPQLLDRFALCVTVCAPPAPSERQMVVERRIAFERDPVRFNEHWSTAQLALQSQIASARASLSQIMCSSEIMEHISLAICNHGVRSLRADLSAVRAAIAYASLSGDSAVETHHIDAVLPLVLAHRGSDTKRPAASPPPPAIPPPSKPKPEEENDSREPSKPLQERIFAPSEAMAPKLNLSFRAAAAGAGRSSSDARNSGPVIGTRQTDFPGEFDLRSTLSHALRETGSIHPRVQDLHERIRKPQAGTRYLFVIDSSGSHAAQQKMRAIKGAVSALLTRSFKRQDEVAMIVFRGTSAQVVLEPTQVLADALGALEYLPTGGRTPLAAALHQALAYLTPSTLLILLTDGRANVALHGGDPWDEALAAARLIDCSALVVDTETSVQRLGQCAELAAMLGARYLPLEDLATLDNLSLHMQPTRARS